MASSDIKLLTVGMRLGISSRCQGRQGLSPTTWLVVQRILTTLKRIRPFLPPSGHPCAINSGLVIQADSVSTGTMESHASQGAAGTTGVPTARNLDTQGVDAKSTLPISTTNSSNTITRDNRVLEFNPLPVRIVTPVNVETLARYLRDYPCPSTRDYLLRGFTHGFDIGFRGDFQDTNSRPRNLRSARNNADLVTEAVAKEVRRGHTSGPFPYPPFPHTHCSPLGSAPKPDGSVRLILDLSSPRGDSVNEGISKEEFACQYSKFDDAVSIVLHLGKGAFLAKADIKHAFRLCPVRPEQWPLLCFQWLGEFFTDTRLAFRARSSPFIFNTFAIALAWIVLHFGGLLFLLHYLDDFFFANVSRHGCQVDLDSFLFYCEELGVPVADDKTEGPDTTITFLGIEIDTVAMTIRLPAEKLIRLKTLLRTWADRQKCTKRELLSLIGLLAFACKVVKPGRTFLRRLIDLSTTVSSLEHYIYLNKQARADILWWVRFLPEWHGVEIIHPPAITSIDLKLYTDASNVGLGCSYGTHWLSSGWAEGWEPTLICHINVRELFAVWAAVFTWGHEWVDKEVVIFSDNSSTVEAWNSGTCNDAWMMAIIRAIFFRAAKLNLNILLAYVPGLENINADLLSRFQIEEFLHLNPQADESPTFLHQSAWTLDGQTWK